MSKYLNTVSAFQFYQLVRYSTLILVGIVFTKTALEQSDIGEYETFIFLAGFVSFFWLNGLLKALLPLSSSVGSSKTNIFSAFVVIQIFSLLAATSLFLLQPFISRIVINENSIPEIGLLLVFIVFGVPANLVEYYYLIRKQNQTIIIYGSVSFFFQFTLVVLPAILGFDIRMSIGGLVLSSLLRYVWLWIIFIRNAEIYMSPKFIRQHLKLGGPLVVATFLSSSAQFVDGFIVSSKFNKETFAVFRYGARELPLAMLLANALSSAMLSEFANKDKLKQNLIKLKKSITKLMHFLFPITAILLFVSKPIFPVIFNPDFADSASIFNIYLLLIISRFLMPQTILNGLQITKPIMSASFFEMLINIGLSLILVQYFGLPGIAFATLIAYLIEKIYLTLIVWHKLKISISTYLPTKIYLLYSIGILVIFAFVEFIF